MLRPALSVLVSAVFVLASEAVGPPAKPATLAEWAKAQEGRTAYGTYFRDKKGWVKGGWLVEDVKVGKRDGVEVLIIHSETYTKTAYEGVTSIRSEKGSNSFELAGDGLLLFAESIKTEDGKSLVRRATRTEKGLRITSRPLKGTQVEARSIAMIKDNLKMHRTFEAWLNSPRKKGDQFTNYGLSWENADGNSKEEFTFNGLFTILHGGTAKDILRVRIKQDGSSMDAEVFPDGKLLKVVMGKFVMMKLEKESEAKNLDNKVVDLQNTTSVFVNKDLGRGRNVIELKLEVTGLGDFEILNSHRQKYVKEKDGKPGILELKEDFRVKEGKPLTKAEQKKYLETTPRIQCTNETIGNKARQIVGDETNVLMQVKMLQKWVYKSIRKTYESNADTSLEVLKNLAGDCTEHSLLFVALCRAVGIPAREVGGLAFVSGGRPLFGWHAWAEVHDGHQWVSVDPTWDEVYVDATHIKMSEGDRDLAWSNVVGSIELKVVEFTKK